MPERKYPTFICGDCGERYGRRQAGVATWHMGTCDICGAYAMLTEPRDFGYLKPGWADEAAAINGHHDA